MNEPLIIDIETNGNDPWAGDLLCIGGHRHGVTDVYDKVPSLWEAWLSDPKIPVACFTLYDVRWLRLAGYKVNGPIIDIRHMAHLLNENQVLSLDAVAKSWCGITMDKRLRRGGGYLSFEKDDGTLVPIKDIRQDADAFQQMQDYCFRDVDATVQVYKTLLAEIKKRKLDEHWIAEEVPFTGVLLDMESNGMPIDMECANALKQSLEYEQKFLTNRMEDYLGYLPNLNSPQQLQRVLYDKLFSESVKLEKADEYPPGFELEKEGRLYAYGTVWRKGLDLKPLYKKNDKGHQVITTSTPALLVNYAGHEWVDLLLRWRKIDKVISTYLESYEQRVHNGRIYGRFHQSGTVTGRLSSSEPNLQNQPAHGDLGNAIRNCFRGRLIVGDHSQLEPRLMAHFSGDKVLLDVYRNDRDIYLVTAEYIFGKKVQKDDVERQIAKTLILALGYGAGPTTLAQILAVNGFPTSEARAKDYLDELEFLYSGFFGWKKAVIKQAKDKGYVKTIGGRYRRLAYALGDAPWKVRNKGERQSVNAIIQGSAADILRRNMLDCRGYPLRLLAQVHDELIWEDTDYNDYPEVVLLSSLEKKCENPGYKLDVPLKFEPSFCKSWADKGNPKPIMEVEDEE